MFFSHAIQEAFILDVLQIGWRAAPDGVTGWLKALLGCLLTVAATGLAQVYRLESYLLKRE